MSEHTAAEAAKAVGRQIRAERAVKGLSREAVALLAGVSAATIARVENGQRVIHLAHLYALAAVLGVPADVILRRAQERIQIADNGLTGG